MKHRDNNELEHINIPCLSKYYVVPRWLLVQDTQLLFELIKDFLSHCSFPRSDATIMPDNENPSASWPVAHERMPTPGPARELGRLRRIRDGNNQLVLNCAAFILCSLTSGVDVSSSRVGVTSVGNCNAHLRLSSLSITKP